MSRPHRDRKRLASLAVAAVALVALLAGCAGSSTAGGQRTLDPALPTAVPQVTDTSGGGDTSTSSEQPATPTAVPTPVPTVGPIDCANGDLGDPFTVPLNLVAGQSLDLTVEIRDQAGSSGQPDAVRRWPVTVTVSDQVGDEWLMIWEAERSALDLPVGFSTSDANSLQAQGLPPMPPAFYRISGDGQFKEMEIPDGFGRGVAQAVRNVAEEEADPAVKDSLTQLADLYGAAPPDVFEVAMTEAAIFHEFAASAFGSEPATSATEARAQAFLLEPVTTSVTTQLDNSLAERGCAAITKRWTVTPEERGQEASRPTLEGLYVGRFDPATGQPSQITQSVTTVSSSDDPNAAPIRREFTTTLTVTRPWS